MNDIWPANWYDYIQNSVTPEVFFGTIAYANFITIEWVENGSALTLSESKIITHVTQPLYDFQFIVLKIYIYIIQLLPKKSSKLQNHSVRL